jgi:hypothetical protein
MSVLTQLPEDRYPDDAFRSFRPVSKFDKGTARALAWLSQLVYENDKEKLNRLCGRLQARLIGDPIVKSVETALPIASTRAMVFGLRGASAIVFAGTDPLVLANWVTDFNIENTAYGAAEGLTVAMEAAKKQILEQLPPAGPIVVTGHSLGGALGILLADQLGNREVTAVYTFGNPRPGRADFAAAYNASELGPRTYRLVYEDDFVPTVAPSDLGFRHVGFYVPTQGGTFAGPVGVLGCDNPKFDEGIVKEFGNFFHRPVSQLADFAAQFEGAAKALLGQAEQTKRDDPVGIAIELLPPRLRDHILDRYIAACAPDGDRECPLNFAAIGR